MKEPGKTNQPDDQKDKPETKRSLLLTIGGYLTVFCGLLGILYGILLMADGMNIVKQLLPEDLSSVIKITESTIKTAGVIVVIFGLITILGGGYVLGRKHYTRAIVFGGVFAFMIHVIFGGIALVLIAVSRRDFK
jgi:hypothetical protein